jgi:hypothetical protein
MIIINYTDFVTHLKSNLDKLSKDMYDSDRDPKQQQIMWWLFPKRI